MHIYARRTRMLLRNNFHEGWKGTMFRKSLIKDHKVASYNRGRTLLIVIARSLPYARFILIDLTEAHCLLCASSRPLCNACRFDKRPMARQQ